VTSASASQRLARLPGLGPLRGRGEAALVREAQGGSGEALEELFRRHWRRAHRAAFLVVGDATAAEDIAQESFLAAVRALDRFDRRRPFGPWLHRIAVNRAIDFSRARALRGETALAEPHERAAEDPQPFSQELLRGLAELSPEHRAVIVLRHLLGYSPGEIGEMLGLARGTVNSRLRRGLDQLRPSIERQRA
jgi:RNA polymerase sigma-70 factor (ECF subfamily)